MLNQFKGFEGVVNDPFSSKTESAATILRKILGVFKQEKFTMLTQKYHPSNLPTYCIVCLQDSCTIIESVNAKRRYFKYSDNDNTLVYNGRPAEPEQIQYFFKCLSKFTKIRINAMLIG